MTTQVSNENHRIIHVALDERSVVRRAAEVEHERAVALKPQSAEAHYNLGVFYELHRKDMGRALAQYRRYRDLGGRDERVERIIGMGGP